MLKVLAQSWPLLLGVMLLMVGNGVQGSLLGIRGALEGFTTFELSVVMSAYFVGFLGGSRVAPEMIRRVGVLRPLFGLKRRPRSVGAQPEAVAVVGGRE